MVIAEVCVESMESALSAVDAGCDRLELCDALSVGGTTPAPRWADLTLQSVQRPMIVLVRLRPGDFCFDATEKSSMLRTIEHYLSLGAAGVAVGAIHDDAWDLQFMKQVASEARGRDLVAHRALDVLLGSRIATTKRIAELMDPLIDLGYRRILTSGGYPSAEQGVNNIRKLVEYAAGRIEIMPGGGITPENAMGILRATDASQIHGSFQQLPRISVQVTFDPLRFQKLKAQIV